MKKEHKAENFLPKPIYPGGPRKIGVFIRENLRYPEDAIKHNVDGTVRIKIEIDYRGKVIGSNILSGLSPSCDEEAKRVVSLLEFHVEQKLRRGKIRFHKTLNIRFKLSDIKPKIQPIILNYEIIKSVPKISKDKPKPSGKSYNFTLNY